MLRVSPADWRRADGILDQVLDLPDEQRGSFLSQACGEDRALRAQVERLLTAAGDDAFLPPGGALCDLSAVWHDDDAPLPEGERVDRYRIVREIGRGGMAVVYLAERADGAYAQGVALKLIKKGIDTDEVIRRFEQERQILALLRHSNIAHLIDGGTTDDGRPYFVLEHVVGRPIDRYCDDERLSIPDRLRLFSRAARAVQHAHRNLVIHRDIKPSNLLVTADGEPKLLDFGIAKLLEDDRSQAVLTRTQGRLMTPAFASPEQVRGETLTTASDIYQLGLLLYRLLVGRWPYALAGRTPDDVARVICEDAPTRPSLAVRTGDAPVPRGDDRRSSPERLRRELSGDLDTIVLAALRKEPSARYASAEHLIDDIGRYLEGRPIAARRASLRYRFGKFLRRHKVAAVAAAMMVASAALYTVGLARERDRARLAADEARTVSDFLAGLFDAAAPTRSHGQQITARELLDRGARWIESDLAGSMRLRVEMMTRLGSVYGELAQFDEAAELLERAVALRRKDAAGDSLALAEALVGLARVRTGQAELEEARTLFEEAAAIRQSALGPGSPAVAAALAGLGTVETARGAFEEAGRWLDRAFAIQLEALGPDHPDVGITLLDLGRLARERYEIETARRHTARAVEILQGAYDGDHPILVGAQVDLANYLRLTGEPGPARQLFERTLPVLERRYGSDHPLLAERLNHYGSALRAMGEHEEALAVHRRAHDVFTAALGADHPQVGDTLNDIGRCHLGVGDLVSAQRSFLAAAEVIEHALGPAHPRLSVILTNQARVAARRGDAENEIALWTSILAIRRETFDQDHAALLEPAIKIGRLKLAAGDPEGAEPYLRQALDLGRRLDPDGTHGTTMPQIALARCLALQGKFGEAAPLLEELVPLLDGTLHSEIRRRLLAALSALEAGRGRAVEAERWRAALQAHTGEAGQSDG